jgi:hypothetical protein
VTEPDGRAPVPAPDLDRARAFVARAEWTFARTMADTPHEYAVREKWFADGGSHEEFSWLVEHIYTAGWNGRWRYRRGKYLTVDEHQYWCMGWPPRQTTIVNRARRDDPRSRAIPCGELRLCVALTKKGEPCRNMAEAPRRHCPVHRHLVSEPEMVRQLEFWSQAPEER